MYLIIYIFSKLISISSVICLVRFNSFVHFTSVFLTDVISEATSMYLAQLSLVF